MRLTLLLVLCITASTAFCQDYKVVDSLKLLIASDKAADTNMVNRCLSVGNAYVWSIPDSALYYLKKALLLSRQLHYKKGEFTALVNMPYALALVREDSAAVSTSFSAIKMAEEANNRADLFTAYSILGNVYIHIRDGNDALIYHRKSLQYIGPTDSLWQYMANTHFAHCFVVLNKPDSALPYVQKIFDYNKRNHFELGWDYYLLGSIYFQKGNNDLALKYYKQALDTEVYQKGYKKSIVDYNLGIAGVYQKKQLWDSAVHYAKNALTIANTTGVSNEILEALNLITNLFESQSKMDSAFVYQKHALVIKDSINNSDKIRSVQLIAFNEDMKKQQEAEQQRKRSATIAIVSLLVVLLFALVVAALIYKNNRQRKRAYNLLHQQKLETDYQKEKAEQALKELKAAQDQLVHAEKLASLGQLTAGIAHEIQNPLNFVNNFSELNVELVKEMEEEIEKGNVQEVKELLHSVKDNSAKIHHHGGRAGAIVKSMLEHSRNSTGQKQPTDINALVDEYLRLSYHGLRAKNKNFNATIETDFDSNLPKIPVVTQEVGRLLLNLFNNAFYAVQEKATKQPDNYKPLVRVTTRQLNNKVEICVADNGTGIPQKILDKIFHPFFTTKPTGEGTGLGLSLSYDIVKAHGGEIKVTSTDCEGAEFRVLMNVS